MSCALGQTATAKDPHGSQECTLSQTIQYIKKHAKAVKRRRLQAQERHEKQQRQAQRDIDALHQALHDVSLPDDLVLEIAGRLRAQKKLSGKSSASCCPRSLGAAVPMS